MIEFLISEFHQDRLRLRERTLGQHTRFPADATVLKAAPRHGWLLDPLVVLDPLYFRSQRVGCPMRACHTPRPHP